MAADLDFLAEAEALRGELSSLRREFHRHPELGNREFRTAERVEACLSALGIPSRRLLDTAVAARLEGVGPGRTVALRADMDALPVQEATGADFASEAPGVMHACGHDVHLAALLGAARLLSAHRNELPGAVVFLFQPDEEGSGGAARMIRAGVLQGVDAVFGAHVSPDLPAGCAGFREGKFYAASDTFTVKVLGRSAHGAEREKSIDALAAAAEMVGRLVALPEALGGERSAVSVGTFAAGTAGNVVADRAEFSGILRTLGPEGRKRMRELFLGTVREAAARFGAQVEPELRESYPGVVNHPGMTRLARSAAEALLGADRVFDLPEPTLTTEDFGYFLQERPGSYYHIGAGCPLPLHSAAFLPEDSAVVTAAAVHAAVAMAFLQAGEDQIDRALGAWGTRSPEGTEL